MKNYAIFIFLLLFFTSCSKQIESPFVANPQDSVTHNAIPPEDKIDTSYYVGIRWMELEALSNDTVSFLDTIIAVRHNSTFYVLQKLYSYYGGSCCKLIVSPQSVLMRDTLKELTKGSYILHMGPQRSLLYKDIHCNADSLAYNMLTETYSCTVYLYDTIVAKKIK